jgi:HTH-type transcriptional repressor of NAD biosynthesis genes
MNTEQVYQKPLNGRRVGIVFGSFAPLHQGHLDAIMRAKKENDAGCIVIVCGLSGDKGECVGLPFDLRYQYVRKMFINDDLVNVYGIHETLDGVPAYPNGWERWLELFHSGIWPLAVSNPITEMYWYVGDEEYFSGLTERGYRCTLLNRSKSTISGTLIRNNPIKYWSKITAPFRREFTKKILVTGTASEGKTTLVQDVGRYFNAPYGEEWARGYMSERCLTDRTLRVEDFFNFLSGQQQHINRLIDSPANNGFIISDTDAIVTQMYAEYYAKDPRFSINENDYKVISSFVDQYAKQTRWDKVFVIAPHGKFVDDHTRFMGHADIKSRNELYNILLRSLEKYGLLDKVTILNGSYYENFIAVVNYIKQEVLYEV